MNKWMTMTCAAGVIAVAAIAWAGPDGRGDGPGRGPGREQGHGGHLGGGLGHLLNNPELATELGITTEQIATLREAQYEHRKKMITLHSEAQLARLEVKKLMDAEPVDQEAVLAAVDAAGLKATALKKSTIQQMLKVREIVGKEALQKLHSHMREAMAERRQGRGDNRPQGQGPGRGRETSMMDDEGPGADFSQMDSDEPAWMQDEMEPPAEESI